MVGVCVIIQYLCQLLILIEVHVQFIDCLRWYLTLQGDNSLKSVERFDHMMFICRFQASQ
jgi:hypothetical protein